MFARMEVFMKTFDEIYEELQSENNDDLNIAWEDVKKENKKMKKIAVVICLIVDILLITIFLKELVKYKSLLFIVFALIFVIIINLVIFGVVSMAGLSKKQRQLNAKYKNTIIRKLISNFYNNLEYFPNKPMPEYIYKQQEYEYYNRYSADDYFEALIDDKYSIQMAEILTQKEEKYKDSDGNTKTRIITKFHGLFAKIVMDKSINSKLKIVQNGELLFDNKLEMDSR